MCGTYALMDLVEASAVREQNTAVSRADTALCKERHEALAFDFTKG